MEDLSAKDVKIQDAFWGPRLDMNANIAIYHQWDQLIKSGCIHNFYLVADQAEGVREGFFFADSDAYKWLEAAARVYQSHPSTKLKTLMDDFIELIGRTQTPDGYIFTYNQFFFPEVRWQNLQIEHELYCLGHLIEAGVSHYEATLERPLLEISIYAADLLVKEFSNAEPEGTPGHQEIEIALIRLYKTTETQTYLDLAENFIEQRGRMRPFLRHILKNKESVDAREAVVRSTQEAYYTSHSERVRKFKLPEDNVSLKPPFGNLRWFYNTATGRYFQQHKPVREQTVPVGHAVRFAYLQTAIAMLYRERRDETLFWALEKAWDHMVSRRMYVTGGVGALGTIEGFGQDYELDPFFSYSETCASLGVIFWNWEMTLASGKAQYSDLSEWQFYNGAAVGLGQDGTSYLYNNPLSCEGGLTRQAWFKCPCCPSNVSRAWADLGKYIFSHEGSDIWVHQYVGCQVQLEDSLEIQMASELPGDGRVSLSLNLPTHREFSLHLRIPSWSEATSLKVNGEAIPLINPSSTISDQAASGHNLTGSGHNPAQSWYQALKRTWHPGDRIEIEFDMSIRIQATHPRVRATLGKVAVTRGPLVYCLESIDNPDLDIFEVELDPSSLSPESSNLFDGIQIIRGKTVDQKELNFLPYYLWANRGESQMTVYVKTR